MTGLRQSGKWKAAPIKTTEAAPLVHYWLRGCCVLTPVYFASNEHCLHLTIFFKTFNWRIIALSAVLVSAILLQSHFSRVGLCATSSLGFSRQEHWSGLPFPSPMGFCHKQCKSAISIHTSGLPRWN